MDAAVLRPPNRVALGYVRFRPPAQVKPDPGPVSYRIPVEVGLARPHPEWPLGAIHDKEAGRRNVQGDDGAGNREPRDAPRTFVLYTFRHTFLPRLGKSGCDPWTLARRGTCGIGIPGRYVRPGNDAVRSALAKIERPNALTQ
jgi:hypothetical protein